jgi:release factor glutamine methyltransferase
MTEQDIQSLLAAAYERLTAVSDSPLLDAEILLCHCLGKPRTFLRTWPEKQLDEAQHNLFQKLISLRRQDTPIAYIIGNREFWSRDFKVSKDVLIPRPDTELLIELSLKLIADKQSVKLIDLGTGSGIIAITLAAESPLTRVTATDISGDALAIAHHNAEMHQVNNISFKQSSWFSDIHDTDFDLVISNPPYIAENDPHLQQGDVQHEPMGALISPEQGLQDIRIIADQARRHLNPKGHLLIEHVYNQQTDVQEIFRFFHYHQINTHTDLSGNPRVTTGIWNP